MNTPVFDGRSREDLLRQVTALARAYTPEWRYEGAEDDPGGAIAALFCEMTYQSVDRLNSVPGKLFTEFLNLSGFHMPGPTPAAGMLQFLAHDTVDEPVGVPAGTQVFTPDAQQENIVYETSRSIQATAAQLEQVVYVDTVDEVIQTLDFTRPQPFFAPTEGENLQRHRFSISQNEVLTLEHPCTIEVELRQQVRFMEADTAKLLAQQDGATWSFWHEGSYFSFDKVWAEGNRIFLEKHNRLNLEPNEDGRICVTCSGKFGGGSALLDGVSLLSRPIDRSRADSLAAGDVPIQPAEGGYCFGRRPAAYSLFYIRSDCSFCKRGALANVGLDIATIVDGLEEQSPQYSFHQRIIDKRDAVAVKPDDVYISDVVWEYFNGRGWRQLEVKGDRNPFSCKREGPLELTFLIPGDITATDVNAETGYYIRARVTYVEHFLSPTPRWLVPFVREVFCTWQYESGKPADYLYAENNGSKVEIADAAGIETLGFPVLESMVPAPRAMYLQFDRSPHALPLSLLFEVVGKVEVEDKLLFEAWTGSRFEPVRSIDLTRNLYHTGAVFLYLTGRVPESVCFGQKGCWLRISRSSLLKGPAPKIGAVRVNAVTAVQCQQAEPQFFSTEVYEAGKRIQLMYQPTLQAQVWVDEGRSLAVAEAEHMERSMPDRVRIEREDAVLVHCWVLWQQFDDLAQAGPGERAFALDAYTGVISFGDGRHGRVPTEGALNLQVHYTYGGGSRGNVPAGAVTSLVGALPRISSVRNLTPMSGGTDRFPAPKVEELAKRRLRHRGRAVGCRDFEDLVAAEFPQALHVKCFSGWDREGRTASGHVTLVVAGCELDSEGVTADLSDKIFSFLSQRCSCCLVAEGKLHVRPSTVITVSTQVSVEMENLDRAATTQQEITRRLETLIDTAWRVREIGSQIRIAEVWQTVRETPNVRLIQKILVEGAYDRDGQLHVVALEDDTVFPYATVKSGTHLIRLY